MKVCILGDNLTSLALSKMLVNLKINVDLISKNFFFNYSKSRTIGISSQNIFFFNKNILNIDKLSWKISEIKIFTDNSDKKNLINFMNPKTKLFSIIKNKDLYKLLNTNLKKNIFFKRKKICKKENYELIINCETNNHLSKKFFFKKIEKNYHSFAYTTIINHQKIDNISAVQVFTKKGPIAFLPISNYQTSIVYSFNDKRINLTRNDFIKVIKKFNQKYLIKKVNKIDFFELKSSNLRNYSFKNILAFGDMLHRVHPLAGQGYNMVIRDIKVLGIILNKRLGLGLPIDSSICEDFEKKTKHKNFIFSQGINFIYEFFNFERKINSELFNKSIYLLLKNKRLNNVFKKIADSGF